MKELQAVVLAQVAESPGGPEGAAGPAKPQQPGWMMWFPAILLIMLLLMWFQSRSQQKKQKGEREQMLGSLKPKDKVETVGGLFGTIVSIRDDELSIRIDDAKDVTVRIAKSAVRGRRGEKREEEKPTS